MKFEEALTAMRNGKKVKLPDRNYFLQIKGIIYYDGIMESPAQILSTDDIVLREDWEIKEETT